MDMIEYPTYWKLDLEGHTISRCVVGDAVYLECYWDKPRVLVTLADEFILRHYSEEYLCQTLYPNTLNIAYQLEGKRITLGQAHYSGLLQLYLCEGWSITAVPAVDYVAWTLETEHGLQIASVPGGSLHIQH